MARCEHRNMVIRETGEEHISHVFLNGELDFHNHEPGNPLPHIEVECYDCGFVKRYSRYHLPHWVARYVKAYEEESIP
jgi:hypothetical protein